MSTILTERDVAQKQKTIASSPSAHSSNISILNSALKIKSGNGWTAADFAETDPNPHNFDCHWTEFTSLSKQTAQVCVHSFPDIVSDSVKDSKHWADCDVLPKLWEDSLSREDDGSRKDAVYIEIGANIGTCVMEMLLSTDAPIIAFEPMPRNYYALRQTISRLDKQFQDRVVLFPIALGSEQQISTIYAASNNFGNSVVGQPLKDSDVRRQKHREQDQFEIRVERIDAILNAVKISDIALVKMDSQGYECNILKGFGKELALKMKHVHFERATRFLDAFGCNDLLPRFRNHGFTIYAGPRIIEPNDESWLPGSIDLDAKRE